MVFSGDKMRVRLQRTASLQGASMGRQASRQAEPSAPPAAWRSHPT